MVAWRTVVADTADELGEMPAARWMCEVASGADRLDDVLDDHVTERMAAHLDAMLARHQAGEPLAYVLGCWGFRHVDLAVDRRVLIPRPETEAVAGTAIELAAAMSRPIVVADLGTGSGAIGLSLAVELPLTGVTVWMTDVDADALAVASANVAGVGRPGRNVHVAHGSWFDAVPEEVQLDLAVANPPYVAIGSPELERSVRDWEPHGALFAGADGLDAIRVLVREAPSRVRVGGWLVLEIGADQGAAVAKLFGEAGYADVEIRPDLTGRDRAAVGQVTRT